MAYYKISFCILKVKILATLLLAGGREQKEAKTTKIEGAAWGTSLTCSATRLCCESRSHFSAGLSSVWEASQALWVVGTTCETVIFGFEWSLWDAEATEGRSRKDSRKKKVIVSVPGLVSPLVVHPYSMTGWEAACDRSQQGSLQLLLHWVRPHSVH